MYNVVNTTYYVLSDYYVNIDLVMVYKICNDVKLSEGISNNVKF